MSRLLSNKYDEIHEYYKTHTRKDTAVKFGCCESTVYNIAKRYNNDRSEEPKKITKKQTSNRRGKLSDMQVVISKKDGTTYLPSEAQAQTEIESNVIEKKPKNNESKGEKVINEVLKELNFLL